MDDANGGTHWNDTAIRRAERSYGISDLSELDQKQDPL